MNRTDYDDTVTHYSLECEDCRAIADKTDLLHCATCNVPVCEEHRVGTLCTVCAGESRAVAA